MTTLKMKKLIELVATSCLFVLAIAYCKPASADQIPMPSEQWQIIVHDSDNNILSIDQGTITRQGNFAGFWTQTISPTSTVAISRVYAVADCSSGAFQALWVAQADRQGKILANNKVNESIKPEKLLADAICRNQNLAVQPPAFPNQVAQALLKSLTKSSPTTAGVFSRTRNYVFK